MQQAAITLARDPKHAPGRGLVMVKSNADLEAERQAKDADREAQNQPIITGLAGEINRQWESARFARNTVEERMIDGLRRRNGEYSPDKLAQIREQGGSEIYMMLTNIKCRAAESWINDILFPGNGDVPFAADPTPIPDMPPDMEQEIAAFVQAEAQAWMIQNQQFLPPEALQERFKQVHDQMETRLKEMAKDIASRMQNRIEDQFAEGGWEDAMREVIKDVITYPAGIIKGPVIRKRKALKWVQTEEGFKPEVATEYRPEYYRVAPFDLYPSPSSKGINDGYLFERHRLRRADLVSMKGVQGYNDWAIDQVLAEYGTGGLRNWLWRDQERAQLEQRPNEWLNHGDTIDCLEFHGSVSGRLLLDWGMPKEKVPDPNQEYQVNAWKVGNYIIRAVLNEDPLGERPYFKASFEEIPGAFWGHGLPWIMRDVQDVCNAAARSLVNNMAIASGPQVEVHTDRVPIGEDITGLGPWKIWQTLSDPHGTNNPAVRFHNVSSSADILMKVFDYFSKLADEYTGIPKYTYGDNPSGGAAGTASGLSMLMSASARGIKQVISHLDRPIEGTVRRTYYFNMLYDPDQSIKGDLKVHAKGAASMVAKEQLMIRRSEFLNNTNNPTDLAIMGQEGRAALLRESVKSFDIPVEDVIPSKEDLMARMQQEMMAAMQQQEAGRTLDPAGNPAGGQDAALFAGQAA